MLIQIPIVKSDPDTFYSTVNDGYIQKFATNYDVSWEATSGGCFNISNDIFVGQYWLNGYYYVNRAFLYFNTSTIPINAIVESANLYLYGKDDFSDVDFNITVQNGQPDYPHIPMKNQDYSEAYYDGVGGFFNTTEYTGGYNTIELNKYGRTWVTRGGFTKFCLRSNREIDKIIPSGNEYVSVASKETGMYPPKLIVTYSIPETPDYPGGEEKVEIELEEEIPIEEELPVFELPKIGLYAIFLSMGIVAVGGILARKKTVKIKRGSKGSTTRIPSNKPRGYSGKMRKAKKWD